MSRLQTIIVLTALLLLAAFLRFHAASADIRFHSDEAFFMTFSRNAAVQGDWMLSGPLDKSPLSIYASALSMHFFAAYTNEAGVIDVDLRTGELAGRLPNTFASLLLIPLIYQISLKIAVRSRWSLQRSRQIGIIAAALASFSPYAIVFGSSAFTDMLMLVFMSAALLMALTGYPATSGLFLAISIGTKQQGFYIAPLLIFIITMQETRRFHALLRFCLAMGTGVCALILWDVLRPGESIFALASRNNQLSRILVPIHLWPRRFEIWMSYLQWLLGPPWLSLPLIAASLVALASKRQRLPLLLGAFGLAYFGLHWLIEFNTYDRYLLPLLPVLYFLTAVSIMRLSEALSPHVLLRRSLLLVLGGSLILSGFFASDWRIDLGRDHYPLDREGEILTVAEYLNARPLGTIVYNPWLGWEMGYYLGAWSDKRVVHYADPITMAEEAALNPEMAPRYFLAPTTVDASFWLQTLETRGFRSQNVLETSRFVIYELIRIQEGLGA